MQNDSNLPFSFCGFFPKEAQKKPKKNFLFLLYPIYVLRMKSQSFHLL